MSTVVEQTQSNIPISYSRSQSALSPLESMQVAHSSLASFESRPSSSFNSNGPSQQLMYNNSPHGTMMPAGVYRSFSDVNGFPPQQLDKPQIYTAVYSGVSVYEMEVNGVAVMRRRSDSWLNATQILKVAGVDKGKRTKVLEKEILTGDHEKVQGGYGKYQGTWINYGRGREFCRQYGVEDLLKPLLDYDMNADGSGVPGQGIDTPTKEQAMAANRKRFYNATMDGRTPSQGASGTFFQNISSTASNAIAAMNKVARMNSPAPPRPGSSQQSQQRRMGSRPSQPPMASQDSFRSTQSMVSERSFGDQAASFQAGNLSFAADPGDLQEPPRKRMRSSQEESFSQPNGNMEIIMRDSTPTEPNESFVFQPTQHVTTADGEAPTALPPLPPPPDKVGEDKQAILTDLFADQSRTDFSNHPAILHLSGADLDMPIDNAANTALHWAATLARVSLMRLLVSKGANMFRGNAAGQTPLMSAVLVNNSLDHSCFPETLEILAPLIELRDVQGRTILHHIAVTCAIKGRAASSKYYLEALLEFLVRSSSNSNSQNASFEGGTNSSGITKPIGLMRFMSEMVNARDKGGNTALNLAARIGNRSIIQQLLEVQADVTIPNYKGMRPIEFGVGTDVDRNGMPSISQLSSPSKSKAPLSKVDETSREMMPLFQSFLSQAETQYNAETRIKQDQIDRTNTTIRELSALQKAELEKLEALRACIRARSDRLHRIQNLRQWIDSQKLALAVSDPSSLAHLSTTVIGDADTDAGAAPAAANTDALPDFFFAGADTAAAIPPSTSPTFLSTPLPDLSPALLPDALDEPHQAFLYSLPPAAVLRAQLAAYVDNNAALAAQAKALRERNGELESQYRKVVSLCTGVDEAKVEEMLPQLVAAVESESPDAVEVGRVKDFLRKVEGVQ